MSSTLYIHLNKLGSNLNVVRNVMKKGVQCMAVIKDNAYGHGFLPVADFLKDKVEWFCVARISEGILLRQQGIENPILVFEKPPAGREADYAKYNLTATITELEVFDRLPAGTPCHIKFDTGMGRLGMAPEDTSLALDKMAQNKHLNYTGIYTHFANSGDVNHPRVSHQLELFKIIRSQFPEELMAHTANSGALLYYPNLDLQFDGVRAGVCLYGFSPGDVPVAGLEPVAEWKAKLVQIKKIKKGEYAGYNGFWQAPKDGWLGIMQVGYAQGLTRNLSGKIEVKAGETLFPLVGLISMDYSSVFLGEHYFRPETEVTLFDGAGLHVSNWASVLGTIPYEVVTAIHPKVQRKYLF